MIMEYTFKKVIVIAILIVYCETSHFSLILLTNT